MVEGYNKNISSNDLRVTPDIKTGELIIWIRALQQALTVKFEHGFSNMQGRTNRFSFFVRDYLLTFPSKSFPEYELSKLKQLALN